MLRSHKLPLAFDPEALKADLKQISPGDWKAHFNRGYYEGEWKGLALRSTTGNVHQLHRPPDDLRAAVDTVVLARCPYFRSVLDEFECTILAARLLSLGPGSKIREHEDYFMGVEYGMIRIHVPVMTDARVEFFVGGERLVMSEGETWYVDFGLPHSVNNLSDRDRVHLVIDCAVNDWVGALIPFDRGATAEARDEREGRAGV